MVDLWVRVQRRFLVRLGPKAIGEPHHNGELYNFKIFYIDNLKAVNNRITCGFQAVNKKYFKIINL